MVFDKNHYQSPDGLLDSTRSVFLGEIDLDPASCASANTRVRAKRFYSEADNGLLHPWHGKVYLNPPYGRGIIEKFIDKLILEVESDRCSEAICVVNTATSTKWFRRLVRASQAVCFPPRISFLNPETDLPMRGNRYEQAIFYFGPERDRFVHVFGLMGPCLAEVL